MGVEIIKLNESTRLLSPTGLFLATVLLPWTPRPYIVTGNSDTILFEETRLFGDKFGRLSDERISILLKKYFTLTEVKILFDPIYKTRIGGKK